MRLIGHVSTAVLIATPLILHREQAPMLAARGIHDVQLLWWVGLFAALPDLDIVLRRFLPIEHRGAASHSLFTVLGVGALLGAGSFLAACPGWLPPLERSLAPLRAWFSPGMILLAMVGVLAHLLGDALTKTGIPLFGGKKWIVPWIGGHAAFDNPALNGIPLLFAAWLLPREFGIGAGILGKLGHWRDLIPYR